MKFAMLKRLNYGWTFLKTNKIFAINDLIFFRMYVDTSKKKEEIFVILSEFIF